MPAINIMYLALSADGSQVVDTASVSSGYIQSLESLGWSAPNGRLFAEWNTKADGSGTSYSAGDLATSSMSLYTIWGEPAVNKVILGTETLLDLTGDTATASDVASGKTFHLASGVQAVGTASGGGGSGVSVFYGTCDTPTTTAAKVAVCEEFTSSDLVAGTVINVKFTYAQTYNGAPTLNVNGTGAKNIRITGNTNAGRYEWVAGEMLQLVYDGTYWVVTDGGRASTTYYGSVKLSSATNSTSTALAATASAVKAAYDLANGKQDALVSGTNIKTINGESLLGSGNISISSGGGSSQWTDISSLAWTFSEDDVATIHAKTNGSLVCLSADVSGFDFVQGNFIVYPPSGYEPSHISVTQFTSETNAEYSDLVGNVVASTSGAIYMALTNPDTYSIDEVQSFTLVYPIA